MALSKIPGRHLNSTSSCMLLLNKKFKVIAFNGMFASYCKAIYGLTPEVGRDGTNYIQHDYRNTFLDSCAATLKGHSQQLERLFNYDKYSIYWHIAYEPVPGPAGEITGVAFTATDISKTLEHEQTIYLQNKSLKQITYLQSHELRKPVSSIIGLMDLLKADGHLETIPELAMMEQAVLELDDMIHKIVDVANTDNLISSSNLTRIMDPAVSSVEQQRLEALARYNPYHLHFKLSFEDLTAMALEISGADVSMINFIDEHQQWSVSQQGADLKPMDRNASICQYTILEESEMEIMSIANDPRFCNSHDILKYNLEYYYGIPVRTFDGHAIAALCVFSKKAKKLNRHQKAMLQLLAQQIIIRMDNTRKVEQLELQLTQLQALKSA